MDPSASPPPTRLRVGAALRAHLASILVFAAIGGLLGLLVTLFLPVAYTAQTNVLVQPLDGNPYAPNAQSSDLTNLETEAQVVISDVIAEDVDEAIGEEVGTVNPADLDVTVTPNTQILAVRFAAADPETAELVSAEYADAYLSYREFLRDSALARRSESLETRIDALTKQLNQLRRADRSNDDPEVRSLGGQLLNLRLQLATLEASDTSPGEVLSAGQARRSGVVVPPLLGLLAGVLLGAAAGAVLAVLRERNAEVLRSVDDVEHLGVAVLGTHHGPGGEAGTGRDLETQTPYDVAFLAGALLNRRAGTPATVAMASVSEGVPVDAFSEDLAQVLAQGREGVVLVDAAGRNGTREAGFSDVLISSLPLSEAVRTPKPGTEEAEDPVDRIAPGRDPENGRLLYATTRTTEALGKAVDVYDWVLLMAPDTRGTAGRALVSACQYWIPVVALGRATRVDLERALAWSDTTGVPAIGIVVVDESPAQGGRARRRRGRKTGG